MVSLTELGLRKLTKNWEKDGAEQENTKRIDTFFDFTQPILKSDYNLL